VKQQIPGTVLMGEDATAVQGQLRAMFLAGGLTLSQVLYLTDLEAHTVQNWVRRGFVPPPIGKKYGLAQFCRIALLNALRSAIPLEQICRLLLAAEFPGLGDDTVYFLYVAYAFGAQEATVPIAPPDAQKARQLEQVLSVFRAAQQAKAWQAEVQHLISEISTSEVSDED